LPTKKPTSKAPTKLSQTEQGVVWHLEHGYRLESDPVGELLLRNLKDNSVIRAAANQSTLKALEERGLISALQGKDKLTTVWKLGRSKEVRQVR
jgi:hypothetical protein